MKGALAENKGREEKDKIRDGEKVSIKGKKEKGGRNQSQIQTRSSSSTPVTAVLPREGKAAGWRCSAALCTHCRAELLLSIATGALEAKLGTDRQLKTKTQHVSLHQRYFKPWLCVRYAGRLEEAHSPTTPVRLSRNPIRTCCSGATSSSCCL